MTVPIVPGPFSFLGEAGQAVGSIAQAKEEAKHHAEQLAEHGMNSLIQDILNGLKPAEMLDDPNVQAMSKKAYGFAFPRGILPQPKEIAQRKQAEAALKGGAAGRAVTGVPSEKVAGAAESTAELKGREAESQMSAGVPEAEAATRAAVAQAQHEGATLNENIFKGALALLGKDPKFARLVYEAATGALEARFRYWEMQRANMTIERQKMVDRLTIMKEDLKEVGNRYDKAQKTWESQLQAYLLEHGDSPDSRKAFAEANPPPDENEIAEKYIQSVHGYGREEFRKRLNQITNEIDQPGAGTTGTSQTPKAGTAPASKPDQGTSRVQKIIGNMSRLDPDAAADGLAQALKDGDVVDEEADAIVAKLRDSQPGSWMRVFNKSYGSARLKETR